MRQGGGWCPPRAGIGVDDSTRAAVLAALAMDLDRLWEHVVNAEAGDLEAAEDLVRDGVLAIGARLLEASVAARGTGKAGPRHPCACGGQASFEGYRAKQAQTVVGWISVRRAYYGCVPCGTGHCPLDAALGLERDSLSPGVRRLTGQLGALLPCAAAGGSVAETARIVLSPCSV